MSYYDDVIIHSDDPDVILGRKIYMTALAGRRGFRDDQLGIDADIWVEIFIEIAEAVREHA